MFLQLVLDQTQIVIFLGNLFRMETESLCYIPETDTPSNLLYFSEKKGSHKAKKREVCRMNQEKTEKYLYFFVNIWR